jgi:hypothetical protein
MSVMIFQWNQKDIDGQPGIYDGRTSLRANSKSISVPSIAASTTFAIKGNPK